jgi:hypothetical protein
VGERLTLVVRRKQKEETMGYDGKVGKALQAFARRIESLDVQVFDLRRFNSIKNALEIQIEEGDYGSDVVSHLFQALRAAARTYNDSDARAMSAAIDALEKAIKK